MDLIAWYGPVKHAHVTLVVLSVVLFAARGVAVIVGARWPMHALPRWGSVAIDTLLLATGALLWTMLGLHPVRQAWLGVKLLLLLVYIVLGSIALRRARTTPLRIAAFIAALAVVASMAGIALAHDPRGWWPA